MPGDPVSGETLSELSSDERLLDPELVERLTALELRARITAEGALSGLHRSPRRGASVEFAEHKEYAPGDELRHVDWKTYGRTDRMYVKRFEEETELHLLLVIDASESMRYGEGETDKLRFASTIAAAIAYLLITRRDRAGLLSTSGEAVPIGGRPSHLRRIAAALAGLQGRGKADLPGTLRRAARLTQRRSQILVLSDLLDADREASLAAARSLRAHGHDPIFVQILHHDERTLPFSETAWFEAIEGGEAARVLADPRAVRRAYLDELARLVEGWRVALGAAKIPFAQLDSSVPPVEALTSLLEGALMPRRGAR